jgi:hypothetical protein
VASNWFNETEQHKSSRAYFDKESVSDVEVEPWLQASKAQQESIRRVFFMIFSGLTNNVLECMQATPAIWRIIYFVGVVNVTLQNPF